MTSFLFIYITLNWLTSQYIAMLNIKLVTTNDSIKELTINASLALRQLYGNDQFFAKAKLLRITTPSISSFDQLGHRHKKSQSSRCASHRQPHLNRNHLLHVALCFKLVNNDYKSFLAIHAKCLMNLFALSSSVYLRADSKRDRGRASES